MQKKNNLKSNLESAKLSKVYFSFVIGGITDTSKEKKQVNRKPVFGTDVEK